MYNLNQLDESDKHTEATLMSKELLQLLGIEQESSLAMSDKLFIPVKSDHNESCDEQGDQIGETILNLQQVINSVQEDDFSQLYKLRTKTKEEISADLRPGQDKQVSITIKRTLIQETTSFIVIIKDIQQIVEEEKQKQVQLYQKLLILSLSHEKITPLNAIINFSKMQNQILENLIKRIDQSMSRREIKTILEHLLGFTKSISSSGKILLIMSRSQVDQYNSMNGKMKLKLQTESSKGLKKKIQSIIDLFEDQIKSVKISTQIQLPDSSSDAALPVSFKADFSVYQEILFSIVANAVKFNKTNGSIDVRVVFLKELNEQKRAQNLIGQLITTVDDTGYGIDQKKKQKLFETFANSDPQATLNYSQGVGVGLFNAKVLTETLGGKISLDSKVNQGTSVTFTVDSYDGSMSDRLFTYRRSVLINSSENNLRVLRSRLSSDCQQSANFYNSPINYQINQISSTLKNSSVFVDSSQCDCKNTALIADRCNFNLIPMEIMLQNEFKFTVFKAQNGLQAVQIFKEQVYKDCCGTKNKLIILDLDMPIFDGFQATQKILKMTQEHCDRDIQELSPRNNFLLKIKDPCYIIGMSSCITDELVQYALNVGMQEVIFKPVNFDTLQRVVKQYILTDKQN